MSTTSATSSLITALGGGSGIDMAALASNLAQAQFAAKIDRLASQSEALEKKISTASTLKSQLSQLASALGERVRTGDLAPAPVINNSAVAQVTRSALTKPSGNYTLEVSALATAQTLTGPPYASASTPVGSGTLTLRFGNATASGFTEDTSHAAVNITIPTGATLADVASAINTAKADVSAYVTQGANGAQLVLKGAEGAANGFILEATETVGEEGLAALAWQPPGGDPARLLATSGDAQFLLDGVAMTSPKNQVGEVAPGLSLTLTGTNSGNPAKISFSDPAASITSAMQDLVSAFNEILATLNAAVDPKTGELSRDDGARNLRRQLTGLPGTVVMPLATGGAPSTFADLGIALQRDGTFRLDTARLQATLARDPEGTAAMFTNGLHGIFATVDKLARNASLTTQGSGALGRSIDLYRTQLSKITLDNTKIAEQQEALRARLAAQFSSADTRIGSSKSTLSFLQAQVAMWTKDN